MPRAFLITRRRYHGTEDVDETGREYSPVRGVQLAEYDCGQQPTSDGASECGSETSSECPEELYNLTKLAEVSLAAAAGTLIHPNNGLVYDCTHSSVPDSVDINRDRCVEGRKRIFFERIELDREIHENRQHCEPNLDSCLAHSSLGGEYTTVPVVPHMKTSTKRTNSMVDITRTEEIEEHECPDCGKKYSTASNLARHRQTHRSLGDKKAKRCPHCDKVYVSIPAFSMHVRTHNQGCKCHYCGKCFSRPWLLQGHIRTHTGEKPFKCTICNKAFADKSNLRAHIQTHSNTKPHVCSRCGKAFALKSYLYKHEESSCMRTHRGSPECIDALDTSRNSPSSISPIAFSRTTSPSISSPSDLTPALINPNKPSVTSCITASPTSVIVPRFQNTLKEQTSPSAFSAIIKNTKMTHSVVDSESSYHKRRRNNESSTGLINSETSNSDFLSRMMIRTSVISPNPEHLIRYAEKNGQLADHLQPPFDLNNSRTSGFSRTSAMTLNLALA